MTLLRPLAIVSLVAAAALIGCGERPAADPMAQANSRLATNDRRGAIVALKAALQKNPQAVDARYLLGKALLDEGDAATAMVELQKARDLGHPDAEVLPPLVRAMTMSGRAKQAIERYAQVTIEQPVGRGALDVSLVLAHSALGDAEAVRRYIAAARQADPANVDAQVLEIRQQAYTGDHAGALVAIEKLADAQPNHAGASHFRGFLLRYVKVDYPAALAAQRKTLALEPRHLLAHAEVMGMLFGMKQIGAMREHLKLMKSSLPFALSTQVYEAQIEFLSDNIQRAKELVQNIMKGGQEDHRALLLVAQIEMKVGSLVQAETHLNKILATTPQSRPARFFLASAYMRMGQVGRTLATLQPLIEAGRADPDALGLAAEALLQQGDVTKAQAYFERAAAADPDNVRLKAAAAMVRIARGKVDEGIADLEAAAGASRETYADMALISIQTRRKNYPAALKAVEVLITKQGEKPLPYFVRGDVQVKSGDLAGARKSFMRAVELDGAYFAAASALAALDREAGDFAAAKKHLEALLKRDPNHHLAHMGLASLKRANNESPESVLGSLNQAVAGSPREPDAYATLANYLLSIRRNKQAQEAAQAGLAKFPDAPALLDPLGAAHLASGEHQQALTVFRKLSNLLPNVSGPQVRLADVFVAQKDIAAARQALAKASEISPQLLAIDVRMMDLAMAAKDHKAALAIAKKAQRKNPKVNLGLLMEGQFHARQGDWPSAATAFKAAWALQKNAEAAVGLHRALVAQRQQAAADRIEESWLADNKQDIQFRLHIAVQATAAKNWVRVEAIFRDILAVKPDDVSANNNVAWAMLKQNKPGASVYAEKAYARAPNRPSVIDTLAHIHLAAGDSARAKKLSQDALNLDSSFHAARLTLARALLLSGDKVAAGKELDALTWLGDKLPEQADVQQLAASIRQ